MTDENIVRCPSCDGYGWVQDDFADASSAEDCDWCKGVGYVYSDLRGVHRPIPREAWAAVAATLERLEIARLREMGYSGDAKKPWEQAVRGGGSAPPPSDEQM